MTSFRNSWDIMIQKKIEALRTQIQDRRHRAKKKEITEGQKLGEEDLELRESRSMGSVENTQNVSCLLNPEAGELSAWGYLREIFTCGRF